MKRSSLFGMTLIAVAGFGVIGSLTGHLPAMLAALFDNKVLIPVTSSNQGTVTLPNGNKVSPTLPNGMKITGPAPF